MIVRYDRRTKIAGIGIAPWPRLGLGRWFDNYAIASLYSWGGPLNDDLPKLLALAEQGPLPKLEKMATPYLLANRKFQRLLTEHLPGYGLLTFRPTKTPKALAAAGLKVIGVDPNFSAKLENKAEIRKLLIDRHIPFPAFRILERSSLTATAAGLQEVLGSETTVVLQDEALSGGRGTYLIRDLDELRVALRKLQDSSSSKRVVISRYIPDARERTVQCCITRYGIFAGPLQKQLIGDPHLSNMNVPGASRYCGGEVTPADPLRNMYDEARRLAQQIGEQLQSFGYRGIFGIDYIVGNDGQLYVLEVNPRQTGFTPPLSMLHREGQDIPLLLLHVLELADIEYTIDDDYVNPEPPEGGVMILHGWENEPTRLTSRLAAGLYNMEQITPMQQHISFDDTTTDGQLLVQPVTAADAKVEPGGQLYALLTNRTILDEQDCLSSDSIRLIDWLRSKTKLKRITV